MTDSTQLTPVDRGASVNQQKAAIITTLEAAHLHIAASAECDADNALADRVLAAITTAWQMIDALHAVGEFVTDNFGQPLPGTLGYALLQSVSDALGTGEAA